MCYFDIGKDLFPWAGSWTRYEIIISNFFKPYLPWVKYFVKYGKVSHETDDIKAITHENIILLLAHIEYFLLMSCVSAKKINIAKI